MPQTTKEDLPKVLTAPEVAALTGYDISSVCRWCRAGDLGPHVIRKTPGRTGTWLLWPSVLTVIQKK
jgi:hypothetical protein